MPEVRIYGTWEYRVKLEFGKGRSSYAVVLTKVPNNELGMAYVMRLGRKQTVESVSAKAAATAKWASAFATCSRTQHRYVTDECLAGANVPRARKSGRGGRTLQSSEERRQRIPSSRAECDGVNGSTPGRRKLPGCDPLFCIEQRDHLNPTSFCINIRNIL
jgi:hypothetical protein